MRISANQVFQNPKKVGLITISSTSFGAYTVVKTRISGRSKAAKKITNNTSATHQIGR